MSVDPANAEMVPRGDYAEILRTIEAEGHCPFCREHLLRHHTKPILRETSNWVLTSNFRPYAGTAHHFVMISQTHMERIEELSSQAWIEFFAVYKWLAQEYGLTGSTLLWRSGETRLTGASVRHLHAQIIVGIPKAGGAVPITGIVGFKTP